MKSHHANSRSALLKQTVMHVSGWQGECTCIKLLKPHMHPEMYACTSSAAQLFLLMVLAYLLCQGYEDSKWACLLQQTMVTINVMHVAKR